MKRTCDVFKGHLFDSAARVEHGYGCMAGVTLPLHRPLRECFRDQRTLIEITRMDMPGLTPESKMHELIDPYNLTLTESLINYSSTWMNYERDRNAPTANYSEYMLLRFPDKVGYVPTPKITYRAKSYRTQDVMRLRMGSDQTRGYPVITDDGTESQEDNLKPRGFTFWTHSHHKLEGE